MPVTQDDAGLQDSIPGMSDDFVLLLKVLS